MPNYYNPYYQNYPYQNQFNNNAFVSVRSEQEAMNYPVAPQTTVIFKDESNQQIYVKTTTNPLNPPSFERYAPISNKQEVQTTQNITYAQKSDLEALRADFERLEKELTKNVTTAVNANASAVKE